MKKSALVLAMFFALAGLAGCAAENYARVPSEARHVSKAEKAITFTAPHDGRVYLQDDTKGSLAYSTDIRRGQTFRFVPSSGDVTLDGKSAGDPVEDADHRHSIYFEPSDRPDLADRPAEGR